MSFKELIIRYSNRLFNCYDKSQNRLIKKIQKVDMQNKFVKAAKVLNSIVSIIFS